VKLELGPSQGIDIGVGVGRAYGCEYYGTTPVEVIEIQASTYFDEDKIAHLADSHDCV